jgi:ectoine hydroxylase
VLTAEDVKLHGLTEAQRAQFADEGYFVLPGALDGQSLAAAVDLADDYLQRFRDRGRGDHDLLNLHDLVGRHPLFLDLATHPTVFHRVWQLMGWNIQLFHTQLVVTPTSAPGATPGPTGWHQDNNRMNLDLSVGLQPMISMKAAYFLTDIPEPGMGNFCIIPGSHLTRDPDDSEGIQVTARAGDVLLFDRRLWHSASTNQSAVTRKVLFYGYSYRWIRPKSAQKVNQLPEFADFHPIQRQLLGDASSAHGYFLPFDEDVPLRQWIERELGPDAVAP